MKKSRTIFMLLIFFATLSFAHKDYKFGVVDGNCLAIPNNFHEGVEYIVVQFDGDKQNIIETKVLKKVTSDNECSFLQENVKSANIKNWRYFYRLDFEANEKIGIAIIKDSIKDLEDYKFSFCGDEKGVLFEIAIKKMGEVFWSRYYYTDKKFEPICKD